MAGQDLVLAGKAGSRGRITHKLTAAGRQMLRIGWRELIAAGPTGDLDADLRTALLTLLIGRSRHLAVEFLREAALRKLESLSTIEEPDPTESVAPLALKYKSLRAASAKALTKAEAAAMKSVARSLPRTFRPKPKQSVDQPKP